MLIGYTAYRSDYFYFALFFVTGRLNLGCLHAWLVIVQLLTGLASYIFCIQVWKVVFLVVLGLVK